MLNKILKSIVNNSFKKISFGSIKITYPDKLFYKYGDGNDYAELEIHSWKAIWLCITKGDIGLAESYFKNYFWNRFSNCYLCNCSKFRHNQNYPHIF